MIEPGAVAKLARISLVIVVSLLLQITLFADLRIGGAMPDIMLLAGIAAGLSAGPDRGASYGFAAGLAYDLVLTSPLGLSALTYALVGYLCGVAREAVLRSTWWIPVLTAAATSALGVILYVVLGVVLGRPTDGLPLVQVVLVVAGVNALLSPVWLRLMAWVEGDGTRRLGAPLR